MIAAADNAEADDPESFDDDKDGGFFLFWRSFYASRYYPDPHMAMMLLFCFKYVRYSRPGVVKMRVGRGWKLVYLKVGQFITGRKKIAEELHIPERTAWDRLRRMEKLGTIKIEVDESGLFSIITVLNWEKYQNRDSGLEAKTRQALRQVSRQAKSDDNSAQANDLRRDEKDDPPSIPPSTSPSLRQASATYETSNKQVRKQEREGAPEVVKPKRSKSSKPTRTFTADEITLPATIDTPGVRASLADWLVFKGQHAFASDLGAKPLEDVCKRYEHDGPQALVDDITTAMASGWSGFYFKDAMERRRNERTKGPTNGSARHDSAEHSPARYRSGRYGDASKWAAKAAAHRTGESPNPEAPAPLAASGAE